MNNYATLYGTTVINATEDTVKLIVAEKEYTVPAKDRIAVVRTNDYKITNGYGAWKVDVRRTSDGGITEMLITQR